MRASETAILLLLGTGLALGCGRETATPDEHEAHDEHEGEAPRTVTLSTEALAAARIGVEPVLRRQLGPTIEVTGSLAYDERRMGVASARIGGRIVEVVADYGARVARGDVLAWIDSPELGAAQAEYRRAVSLTRLRRAEHERAAVLVEGGALSRGELLRREADWRAAEAELETAEQKLHLLGLGDEDVEALAAQDARPGTVYPVRTPVGGKVTERSASPGQIVAADERLFVVADLRTLWLFLQVFEKDLPSVRSGTRVTLSCESHPEDRFEGSIDFVGDVLDPHTRTIAARAVIDNAAGLLKPGMFVYARLGGTEAAEAEPVLAVPAAAVERIDGRDVVFLETAERTFEVREVALGRRSEEWIEVLSGLEEGRRVAVAGTFTLKSELLAGSLEEHHH